MPTTNHIHSIPTYSPKHFSILIDITKTSLDTIIFPSTNAIASKPQYPPSTHYQNPQSTKPSSLNHTPLTSSFYTPPISHFSFLKQCSYFTPFNTPNKTFTKNQHSTTSLNTPPSPFTLFIHTPLFHPIPSSSFPFYSLTSSPVSQIQ